MDLKEAIESSGKTRYQISKETGMSQGTLKKYWDGSSKISGMTLGTAIKLSKSLGYESLDGFVKELIDD